ncbi:MAG: alpha/beta fold hydrolase [Nocardioides sp.]|nr:alpha/beta fold hydrolase [Nocardioides sp.]
MTQEPGPVLTPVGRTRSPEAASVLFLHGGRPHDVRRTTPRDLPFLRVLALARATARRQRGRAQVFMVRNRRRGWNGGDPVADAHWAVGEVLERRPDAPVVLVGHSMGARAALLTAADLPEVSRVVALATWIERQDAPQLRRIDCPVHLAHGDADRVTAPESSSYVERVVTEAGGSVALTLVPGGNHSLTVPWVVWTTVVSGALDQG